MYHISLSIKTVHSFFFSSLFFSCSLFVNTCQLPYWERYFLYVLQRSIRSNMLIESNAYNNWLWARASALAGPFFFRLWQQSLQIDTVAWYRLKKKKKSVNNIKVFAILIGYRKLFDWQLKIMVAKHWLVKVLLVFFAFKIYIVVLLVNCHRRRCSARKWINNLILVHTVSENW